jgi:hypothetical protein
MIAPESNHVDDPHPAGELPAEDEGPRSDQPVTTLRGATVDVDIRRAGQVVVGICLTALAITGIVLLIAGIQNNSQVNDLRQHGIPVTVTVTVCRGLIGGTGAQVAGYSCTGTYTVDGTQYRQSIPGLAFHTPGSTIRGVAVPGDPRLLSTPDQLGRQHASWRVFIIPGVLLSVVVAVSALLVRRRATASRRAGTVAVGPR